MNDDQKVTVTVKTPDQTVKMNLTIPESEVGDVVNAICAQCEDYEENNFGDVDYHDEEDFDDEDFEFDDLDEEG